MSGILRGSQHGSMGSKDGWGPWGPLDSTVHGMECPEPAGLNHRGLERTGCVSKAQAKRGKPGPGYFPALPPPRRKPTRRHSALLRTPGKGQARVKHHRSFFLPVNFGSLGGFKQATECRPSPHLDFLWAKPTGGKAAPQPQHCWGGAEGSCGHSGADEGPGCVARFHLLVFARSDSKSVD